MRKADLRPEQEEEQPRQPVAERPGERSPVAAMTTQNILALQRTAGNQAVARAVGGATLARMKPDRDRRGSPWWSYVHPTALKNRIKTRMRRAQEEPEPLSTGDPEPEPYSAWHVAIEEQRRRYAEHEKEFVAGHQPVPWEFEHASPPGALEEARRAKTPLAEHSDAPWEFDG